MTKDLKDKYRQQDLQRLRGFRLMDDDFMSKCFENNIECTELVLHIVLGRDDLKVEKVETQHLMKNLQGRSIILDIYATDRIGKRYNIEIQRADRGAGAKRARYHSSLIDANITEPGDELPIYHINRVIEETGKKFQDEAHIIYVNGAYRDKSPLGILMQDFSCTDPDDITYEVLAERVGYFKEDEEGVAAMCKAMEDMRTEAVMDDRKDTACRLLKKGRMSLEEIAEISKLSIEEVRMLTVQKDSQI